MKKTTGFLCGVRAILALAISAVVLNFSVSSEAAEFLVKYRTAAVLSSQLASTDLQITDIHQEGRLFKVDIQADQRGLKAYAHLINNPQIEYIVPNFKIHALRDQVDKTELQKQWSIAKVEAEKAWGTVGNKGSRNIKVAVIDTGTDYKHKNLAPNMIEGYDFINSSNDPMDVTGQANPGHGTHCAGIVGATGLIDGGTVGISPEVSIMPLRFLDEKGQGDLNMAIKAIDYAIAKKVDIISASWGAAVPRSSAKPLIEAIERADKAGIMFVAAASNDGKNNDSYEVYPANSGVQNMIVVSASGSGDAKPQWSNYGKSSVSLAAPGEGIMSTLPNGKYGNLSGTSMATPMVAGFAAFIKAQDNALTPVQIRALMQASADKVGIETACDCRINAFGAAQVLKNKKMFVAPFAETIGENESMKFAGVYGKAPLQFSVSDSKVASIDQDGNLKGLTKGKVTVSVKDAGGQTASSYDIIIGKVDRGGDGGGEECPFGDPTWCEIACGLFPVIGIDFPLPFCG